MRESQANHCPYHQNKSEAANRSKIVRELSDVFNPLIATLAEKVEGGQKLPFRSSLEVTEESYSKKVPFVRYPALHGTTQLYDRYVTASANVSFPVRDLELARFPIGNNYDRTFAEESLRTIVATVEAVEEEGMMREIDRIATENSTVILNHTYQGMYLQDPFKALVVTVEQAIVNLGQGKGLLSVDGIPGYEEKPYDLMSRLTEERMTSRFALNVGSHFPSLLVWEGRYIQNPIENTKGDEKTLVDFSPHAKEHMKRHLTSYRKRIADKRQPTELKAQEEVDIWMKIDDPSEHYEQARGKICPAATKNGGIDIIDGVLTAGVLYQSS